MQQLTRNLRLVEPIVQHGLAELQSGMPITHTLREVALMGSLVGTGMTPTRAIRQVESVEAQLLGLGPGEAAETFHTGVMGTAPYGYGAGTMYGTAMPYGYAQAISPMGYTQSVMPMGYGQQAVMPMGYGQQAVMPYGKSLGY